MSHGVRRTPHAAVALSGSFSATLIIQLLNSVTGIILARSFAPAARGELAVILLWPNLFGIVATVGLFESTTYHVASREAPRGAILGSGIALAAIQSAVFTILAAVALPLIMHRYSSHALFVSFTYLPYVPLSVLSLMLLGLVNGVSKDTSFHLMRVLVIAVSAVLLLALALVHELTFQAAVISYLIAQVVTLFWSLVLSLQQLDGGIRVERRLIRSMFVYGLSSHSSSISSQLNQRLDVLVVSLFLSARDLGLYAIASSITSVSYMLGISMAYVILPRVAAAKTAHRKLVLARRATCVTFWVSLLSAVPIVLVTPAVVRLLFGARYADAGSVSQILIIAGIALGAARALEAVLRGLRRPLQAGLSEIIALVVTVVALAILIPQWGITGAAISSLLAYCTSMLVMAILTARALDAPVTALFKPTREDRVAIAHARRHLVALIRRRAKTHEVK